jgi:glycyl-tRNA synthetase
MLPQIPFGIAQIGKAFRNEITPRHFLFRSRSVSLSLSLSLASLYSMSRREFEQMEIEYFVGPEDHIWPEAQEKWVSDSWAWLLKVGLREDWLRRKVHTRESGLAHYAKACTDIEFHYPFGFQVSPDRSSPRPPDCSLPLSPSPQELMGISARGSFDLDQHSLHSGKPLEYTAVDNEGGKNTSVKFVPHTIEPSIGLDRSDPPLIMLPLSSF